MQTPTRFRKYAEECRYLARMLSGEQKNALLEIATAWDECAAQAEGTGNGGDGKAAPYGPLRRPKPRGSR